jgi:PIN domain nuclease of toxin-antitoxin system
VKVVNLLLDTPIALWAITDAPALPAHAPALSSEPANEVWVSAASVWEIAIKHGLGRGDMPISGVEALGYFDEAGYRMLPITPAHTAAVASLSPHHQDPFDRLLVAQACAEPLRLLTHDASVALYGEPVLRV